jgi:hypothetical protein
MLTRTFLSRDRKGAVGTSFGERSAMLLLSRNKKVARACLTHHDLGFGPRGASGISPMATR